MKIARVCFTFLVLNLSLLFAQRPVAAAGNSRTNSFLVMPPYQGLRSAGTFSCGVSNTLAVLQVFIDRGITLQQAKTAVNSVSTASDVYYYAGFYTVSGNLLGYAKFPIGTGSPTGQITVSLTNSITLSRGYYLLVQGSDDNGAIATGQDYQYDTDMTNEIPLSGQSGPVISEGALPSTLGTVAEPYPASMPFVVFY